MRQRIPGASSYELLVRSLMSGRALQLMKPVEDSNGFDVWTRLNKALKPISKANFKGKRLSALGSSHYMASIFNE